LRKTTAFVFCLNAPNHVYVNLPIASGSHVNYYCCLSESAALLVPQSEVVGVDGKGTQSEDGAENV